MKCKTALLVIVGFFVFTGVAAADPLWASGDAGLASQITGVDACDWTTSPVYVVSTYYDSTYDPSGWQVDSCAGNPTDYDANIVGEYGTDIGVGHTVHLTNIPGIADAYVFVPNDGLGQSVTCTIVACDLGYSTWGFDMYPSGTDAGLGSAIGSIISYFGDNIAVAFAAIFAICGFLWMMRLAFKTFDIKKGRVL